MNKSAIKNFAVTARIKLMEAIEQKAYELGITEKEIKGPEVYKDGFRVNDKFFKKHQIKQREKLIQKIQDKGFNQVLEEVTYTWFNRFIAIRFMEVNDYLPTGVRVLSSIDHGKMEPDVVTNVLTIADDLELDLEVVYLFQDENNTEELFKYILVKQCNKLGEIMQIMFERIEDYSELLLPDQLLAEGSVVRDLITMIDEEDWKEQVEIIGWLYQYYISEKKDQVFSDLKKNKKITKENIPAATQLFTPKWIVQYMVENSLGRLWLESHPDEELQKRWNHYLKGAQQEPEIARQLEKIKDKNLSPEKIKVLDPCMGSGHILVYAFDVLYQIYKQAGYAERDIPKLIIENNLFGIDIDERAAQLAYFAIMMKGRSYYRRFFRDKVETNLISVQETNAIPKDAVQYFQEFNTNEKYDKADINYLIEVFKDAKEYGSILDIKSMDFEALERRLASIKEQKNITDIFSLESRDIVLDNFYQIIKQAKMMSNKYDVVVSNPPYMGYRGMNAKLYEFVKKHYPNSKSDLGIVFIEKCNDFAKSQSYVSLITMQSWLFLGSYENFRKEMIQHSSIVNLVHLGARAFDDIGGEVVQTVSWVMRKSIVDQKGVYIRLVDYHSSSLKEENFFEAENRYNNNMLKFLEINGYPIAYWLENEIIQIFKDNAKLSAIVDARKGMVTADNERFIRFWSEVNYAKIGFYIESRVESIRSGKKWFPYSKGGSFRRWYGNNDYIVNWENDGQELLNMKAEGYKVGSTNHNLQYIFSHGITWSDLTTGGYSGRYMPTGFLFDSTGPTMFLYQDDEKMLNYLLGYVNSKLFQKLLDITCSGLHYTNGVVVQLPYIKCENRELFQKIINLVEENRTISKEEWDDNERSWDFIKHPFYKKNIKENTLKETFNNWKAYCLERFSKLKQNEEQLNQIFNELGNVSHIIENEVTENEIAIVQADVVRDIKSFISYSIGCIFGRYSLNYNGLVYAGGEFDPSKYGLFKVDSDNVIPITDDEYFEDDIVSRFIDFVRMTFGQDNLEENLNFIANALAKKVNETSRQCIRRYFLKEYYKDHLQAYQKRPIYWLFDSGKQDGFKALIYMHRYDGGTVAKVRTDYLHTLQRKYEGEISRLDLIQDSDVSIQEKTTARKRKEKIQKQLLECQQYDQVVAHVANQIIELDLDDGVKVNYEKFQNIDVSQGEGKKPMKANLLAKL